ncbi:MAG: hypothetical protein II574_02410, partial [Ruminococcus sp.]|nr:hypothetical protein [Ruminococcus sp.]
AFSRMETEAYNLMDAQDMIRFTEKSGKMVKVPFSEQSVWYDPTKRVGIGMLIHYCYYVLGLPVEVIAPSREVAEDVGYLLRRLDGCCEKGYTLLTADEVSYDWITAVIPTKHTPELEGRCFGWCLDIGGQRVVYTGDTCIFEPYLEYLTQGAYLYTEISAYDETVHLGLEKLLAYADELKQKQIKVFLMHLDDERVIEQAAEKLGAQLAPLIDK